MSSNHHQLLGAIEAGGTKWVCAVGTLDDGILEERVIPTGEPSETLPAVFAAFEELQGQFGRVAAIGVGTFGPVMVRHDAPDYGTILNSPKRAWQGFSYVDSLASLFGSGTPVVVDTDVNAAALAEAGQTGNRGDQTLVYVTIGTGIGGGVVSNGQLWHGRLHPEIGHIMVPESSLEPGPGFSCCPFHDSCLEGKASGTAIFERWGQAAEELPADHLAWKVEADYLASMAVSLTATFSPDLIVFGGGVAKFEPLLPMVREQFVSRAGGYWTFPPVEDYLVKSGMDDRAGLHGALMLAAKERH